LGKRKKTAHYFGTNIKPTTGGRGMISSGQIKEVHFERIFNLGNYESFRIGLTATVGPKQTAKQLEETIPEFMKYLPGTTAEVVTALVPIEQINRIRNILQKETV
jgi:hypothetical protein